MVELEATNKADVKRKLLLEKDQVDMKSQVSENKGTNYSDNLIQLFDLNRSVCGSCVGRKEKN